MIDNEGLDKKFTKGGSWRYLCEIGKTRHSEHSYGGGEARVSEDCWSRWGRKDDESERAPTCGGDKLVGFVLTPHCPSFLLLDGSRLRLEGGAYKLWLHSKPLTYGTCIR